METKVYWSAIEYAYLEGNTNYGKLKGGFVYVFLSAFDARKALELILKELEQLRLSPVEIEFISQYDKEMEWETQVETAKYFTLYDEAKTSGRPIFDAFYAFDEVKTDELT